MNHHHVIEHAAFDIAFGSEEEAFEQQADLGVLVKTRLMRVVERVFDEMSAGEGVFRINSLEVCLGDMAYFGYQEELEVRLEVRLRAALREKLAAIRNQAGSQEVAFTREQTELEQLEYFLLNGRLPWHAALGPGDTFDQLLQRVIQSNSSGLVEFLRRSPGRPMAINRLISQFPDEILAEIGRMLWPGNTSFPVSLIDDFRKIWRRHRSLEATEREFRAFIWEQLISELLDLPRDSYDRGDLVGRITKRITLPLGTNPDIIPPQVADAITYQEQEAGVPAGAAEERQRNNIEPLRRRLADAISRGDGEEFRNVWQSLLRYGPEVTLEEFRIYGRQIKVRRLIASALPESMLGDLVDLLEPAQARFIKETMGKTSSLLQSLGHPGMRMDMLDKRLWEVTLAYLLVECDRRFDKRYYIRTLIQQTASQNHIEYQGLIRSLAGALVPARISNSMPSELAGIVGSLVAEEDTSRPNPEDSGAESLGLIQSFELYERLLQRLLADESKEGEDASDLTPLLDQLVREYPWQLRRLYRGLQAGDFAVARIAAALSVAELSHLVPALLSVIQPAETAAPSDLMTAIEAFAGQARDSKGYYRAVLECLVQNRNIDFASIIESDESVAIAAGIDPYDYEESLPPDFIVEGPPPSKGDQSTQALVDYSKEGAVEDSGTESRNLIQSFEIYERLWQRLLAGESREGKEASDLTPLLDQLIREYPWQLRRLYRDLQAGDITVAGIAAALSVAELSHLVPALLSVIRPAEAAGPSDLMTAIETYAGRVRDLKAYYQRVLECLVQNRNIDFASIIESDESVSKAPGIDPYDHEESLPPDFTVEVPPPSKGDQSTQALVDYSKEGAVEDSGTESPNLIQSFELYERLWQRLLAGESREGKEGSDLTPLLDQLIKEYPWQLRRLYRDLQAGDLTAAGIAAALSAAELSHLVPALLSVIQQAEAAAPSDLMTAIETHAGRARDLKEYYRRVLECLVQNRNIDFATIIESGIESANESGRFISESGDQEPDPGEPDADEEALPGSLLSLQIEGIPQPVSDDSTEVLLGYLSHGGTLSAEDAARLIRTSELLLAQQSGRLRQLLGPVLEIREAGARIAQLMPERLLTRVLYLLRPWAHAGAQRSADIIADACQEPGLSLETARVRQLKWQYIFRHLLEEGLPYDERSFARGLVGYLASETEQGDTGAFRAHLSQLIIRDALPATRERHAAIARALTGEGESEATPTAWPEPVASLGSSTAVASDSTEDIYIANAGQVLAAPYLSRLFAMLDLTEAAAFKDRQAAERAVHLLQFMVNESTDSPEYWLVLNKILCGVRVGLPIDREIEITDREKEVVEGLILGMIQNWKTIGNTSVTGFRESFLQRGGRLWLQNDAWHLQVEPRAFDMLLDSLPWSFSTIKFPWMERVIYVEWR